MKFLAIQANEEGNQLLDQGDYLKAEQKFRKAIKQAPDWSVPWFNLGLVYKQVKNWQKSLECNERATQLNSKDEGAWWNMGIAATALGKWTIARKAWTAYGVKLSPGHGPIEMNLGLTPIRLNGYGTTEVVWCDRIDPARALIRNIPFPACGHRYGDLVLHDGQPNGYRQYQGREVPVFDELALLEASPFATYEVVVEANNLADRAALEHMAEARHVHIEDWSQVRMLCYLCSTGRPHEHHQPQTAVDGPLIRYGLAAVEKAEISALLETWQMNHSGCFILEFNCVLSSEP